MSAPITAFAHYRVTPGHLDEYLAILDAHWPLLRGLELVTDRQQEVYVGEEKGLEGPYVIEIFDWADEEASARAHQHPSVSAMWEQMGEHCESRGGKPPFEFPNLRRVQ